MSIVLRIRQLLMTPIVIGLGFHTVAESFPAKADTPKLGFQTKGTAFGLRFESDTSVSYCDKEGSQIINLQTGKANHFSRECKPEGAGNTNCDVPGLDIEIRVPSVEPTKNLKDGEIFLGGNDIVEVGGSSYPMVGHIEDCAVDGKSISIVTESRIVRINTEKETHYDLDKNGGNRIVTRAGWSVWSTDTQVKSAFQWNTYTIPNLGIQGCYPSDVLSEQSNPETNGSHKLFKGNGATLNVFGSTMEENASLKAEYSAALKSRSSGNGKVTYKVFKEDWFVLSGTDGNDIFYNKSQLFGKVLGTWELKYDKSQKKIFDPLVKPLVTTFGPIPK